jgi:hypothetical protein
MSPLAVGQIIQYAILPWLFLLFAVVMLKIMRGDINNVGLLRTKLGAPIDPERVSTMASAALAIGGYGLTVLNSGAVRDPVSGAFSMPDAPLTLVALLGGANAIYLIGKFQRLRS